ncbi:MAG: aminoglycoside phosphotransferase family protein [Acidobacteriia bacterium]|nr:aminoglycoside phosphotransferase family protein [Terriglobia bacterium]
MTTATENRVKVELASRIASAMSLRDAEVKVETCHVDVRSTSCTGLIAGRAFFAKHFTADPYRVVSALPWREELSDSVASRPRADQFQVERNAAQTFRCMAGLAHVPAMLGCSEREAIILWEKAEGVRLDQMLVRSRWMPGTGDSFSNALGVAGAWLRRVHDASREGSREFDLHSLSRAIQQKIKAEPWAEQTYARTAIQRLQEASDAIGDNGKLELPVVLNHGDFTLANLLWNGTRLSVLDFENPIVAAPFYDLLTLTFSLRRKLLNPLVSRNVVQAAEKSFWKAYGAVPSQLATFLNAVATARVLCQCSPRPAKQRRQRGWLNAAAAAVYHNVLESSMLTRCLES